jgi:hypothetical protein
MHWSSNVWRITPRLRVCLGLLCMAAALAMFLLVVWSIPTPDFRRASGRPIDFWGPPWIAVWLALRVLTPCAFILGVWLINSIEDD